MSSIYTHDGYDSGYDSDDDKIINLDHVDPFSHHDEDYDHSNDLSDDQEEFPMPVQVPMPRETEVAGSLRETRLPAVPTKWEIPYRSPSESLEVDLEVEKELEDLRTQVRLLKQQNHEKQHEPAHSDQRPSKGMAFDIRRRQHDKHLDNTHGGLFSNHDQHPGPTAQAASTKANMQLHSAESQMPVPGPYFPREHHERNYETSHDTQRDHRGSIRDLRTKLVAENQARINRGEGKGGIRFMTPLTTPHHSNPYSNINGGSRRAARNQEGHPERGGPQIKF